VEPSVKILGAFRRLASGDRHPVARHGAKPEARLSGSCVTTAKAVFERYGFTFLVQSAS
jgi:hypothetical protein